MKSRRGGLVASVGVVAVILGIVVAARVQSQSPQAALRARNPVPATQESLSTGERIYRAHCQVCHGVNGRGDGPAAATLSRPPADLRIHMAAGHTDGQLFYWVTYGMAGLPMPAFRDRLSGEERWHVINFIRTFGLPLSQ